MDAEKLIPDPQRHHGDRPAPSPHTSHNRQETHSETPGLTGSRIRFAPYDTQPLLGHPWKLLGLHPNFVQRAVSATLLPVYLLGPRDSLLI